MGPLIVLDKSVFQGLSYAACRELGRYFYVVIAPVMLLEILADLKHEKGTEDENRALVKSLLDKIPRLHMAVVPSYQTLCVQEIAGVRIGRPRGQIRQVPAWGHSVPTSAGRFAMVKESPEAEAMTRWEMGFISEGEELLASEWRRVTKGLDLERFRHKFRALGRAFSTIEEIDTAVRSLLADESTQLAVLETLLGSWPDSHRMVATLRSQWRLVAEMRPGRHWWYNIHCGRVLLTLLTAVGAGVIGTRSTNRVDAEYFNYTPFAHIFVSGDRNSHGVLARALLDPEQTYLDREDFRTALQELADRRAEAVTRGRDPTSEDLDPAPGSLVHDLHVKHLGEFRSLRPHDSGALPPHITPNYLSRIIQEAEAAIRLNPERYPSPPPWPR
jgi:hypothetical protein